MEATFIFEEENEENACLSPSDHTTITSALVRRKGSKTLPIQLCSAMAVKAVSAVVAGKNQRLRGPIIKMKRVNATHDAPDRQTTSILLDGCRGRWRRTQIEKEATRSRTSRIHPRGSSSINGRNVR